MRTCAGSTPGPDWKGEETRGPKRARLGERDEGQGANCFADILGVPGVFCTTLTAYSILASGLSLPLAHEFTTRYHVPSVYHVVASANATLALATQ